MIESLILKNTVLGTQIAINKDKGEYWLNQVDFGQVESAVNTFKFVNQIGETVYNTTIGPRNISISGWVASWDEDKVHELKDKLNHFINPRHLIEVSTNGKRIQFYPKASIRYSPNYRENNEVISKFLISGYCPYPLFTDNREKSVLVAYTDKRFKFPLIIPRNKGVVMGVRHPSLIAEITNKGDLPVGYIIELRAYGTVVNPILIDIGSQQSIQINKTMTNGEIITIDTREGSRHIRGSIDGVESNYFKYRSLDSDWLSLERGINYIRYNADSGVTALEVYIRFEPGYLEVDT